MKPTSPLSTRDKLLDSIAKDVRRTQPRLAFFRQRPQPSPFNPLSPTASQPISSLSALTDRILKIEELAANTSIPNPGLQVNDSRPSSRASSSRSPTPTLSIVPPSPPPALPISETHQSSLLRVLFLFSLLHPHQPYTQGLNEVLAPIYYVLASYPFDPRDPAADPAHAEADAFWIFTEIIGEFGAVIGHPDEWARGSEGVGNRFSERLKWADPSLWQFLVREGPFVLSIVWCIDGLLALRNGIHSNRNFPTGPSKSSEYLF